MQQLFISHVSCLKKRLRTTQNFGWIGMLVRFPTRRILPDLPTQSGVLRNSTWPVHIYPSFSVRDALLKEFMLVKMNVYAFVPCLMPCQSLPAKLGIFPCISGAKEPIAWFLTKACTQSDTRIPTHLMHMAWFLYPGQASRVDIQKLFLLVSKIIFNYFNLFSYTILLATTTSSNFVKLFWLNFFIYILY